MLTQWPVLTFGINGYYQELWLTCDGCYLVRQWKFDLVFALLRWNW